MAGTTRDQIVELADSLYRSRGYAGFSYHDISQVLGIKNAAIHYHFPKKSDLGAEIIDRAKQTFQDWLSSVNLSDLSRVDQLRVTVEFLYRTHIRENRNACLIGISAISYELITETMRNSVKELTSQIKAWFTTILDEGRDEGEFRYFGESVTKAEMVMAALSGALQNSRLGGGLAYFDRVAEQIMIDLNINNL